MGVIFRYSQTSLVCFVYDIDKQIVYIGIIDPAVFNSGLIFGLDIYSHCHFGWLILS